MPFVGAAVGLVMIGTAMRRKGVVSGAVDTGLNSVPLLGALKNTVEYLRGRDFFPDRVGQGLSGRR